MQSIRSVFTRKDSKPGSKTTAADQRTNGSVGNSGQEPSQETTTSKDTQNLSVMGEYAQRAKQLRRGYKGDLRREGGIPYQVEPRRRPPRPRDGSGQQWEGGSSSGTQ